MNRTSKMDLHGVRTAADVERKYNFGKTFAEVMGIANDAQSLARKAVELDEDLSAEEIFNRLTNNGTAQGIFRGADGEIYINADYIVSLASMFAKDIEMTGTFTCETECYLPPDDEVIQMIEAHLAGGVTIPNELIPLYDFWGEDSDEPDGKITEDDLRAAKAFKNGYELMWMWPNARKTPATMTIGLTDPEFAIRFTGTNMWGREVEGYWGVNFTSVRNPEDAERIEELEHFTYLLETRIGSLEERLNALET